MPLNVHTDLAVVRPVGRVDSATAGDLEAQVRERLGAGCRRLVFDLGAVDYVSSAGLRVMLMAVKQLRGLEGRVFLAGLNEDVREVFAMSGVLALFTVTHSVDEARRA